MKTSTSTKSIALDLITKQIKENPLPPREPVMFDNTLWHIRKATTGRR